MMHSRLGSFAARFDALQLRERVLVTVAALAVILAVFYALLLRQLDARRLALTTQLASIVAEDQSMAAAVSSAGGPDSGIESAQVRSRNLSASLAAVTARLRSRSAGLIPPRRMSQVIRDVLSRQPGVELISLRSLAAYPLLAPSGGSDDAPGAASSGIVNSGFAADGQATAAISRDQGPYVHTMVMVLQGRYLAVLAYLGALERLPWHFYWASLHLDASRYPVTRVTVTLRTLSTNRDWIDL